MKKAAIYIRVSTDDQVEKGFSIPEQHDRLVAYCKAKDYDITGVYTDPGFSGKDLNRPNLQLLIDNIKQYNVVVIYKLDRLSRSQKDTLTLIEDVFMKNNVDIVSLQENLDTSTPSGRMMIGILSAFAQLERETIRERLLMGRTGRAKKGKWVGTSRPPIGYEYVNQQLIVNEYEAEQIRKIFELYTSGIGMQKIAGIMRESGYTNKYGSWQGWGNLSLILSNPVYIGKVSFDEKFFNGNHEPIIDEDTFNRVQELLNTRKADEVFKKKHPFSHLLECANCGDRLFYNPRKSRKGGYLPKYQCRSRPKCDLPIWKTEIIDEQILLRISQISTNKKLVQKYMAPSKKTRVDHSRLEKRLSEIDKQTSKLLELYQFDSIPTDELNSRIKGLQDEKHGITRMIQSDKEKTATMTVAEVQETATNLLQQWDEMDLQTKVDAVNSLIKKIVVSRSSLDIYWTFSYAAIE